MKVSVDKTGAIDSDNLDILAQALFETGEIDAAIETEHEGARPAGRIERGCTRSRPRA